LTRRMGNHVNIGRPDNEILSSGEVVLTRRHRIIEAERHSLNAADF
jgi:hypothetical protein